MAIIDCSCRGINPECIKCSGMGYYDSDKIDEKMRINTLKKVEDSNPDDLIPFHELIKELSHSQIRILDARLVKAIRFETKRLRICKNQRMKIEIQEKLNNLQSNYSVLMNRLNK